MSDGTRFAIIGVLDDGPKSVTEKAEALEIDEPGVSHYLTTLKYASLVSDQRGERCQVRILHFSLLSAESGEDFNPVAERTN